MNPRAFLLMSLFVVSFGDVQSQDDRPWWRQLFGQSEVEAGGVIQDEESNPAVDEVPVPTELDRGTPVDSSAEGEGREGIGEVQSRTPGAVNWHVPAGIAALDSARLEPDEIRIPGYRVQLFMGRLDSARALRQSLLADPDWAWPVYVTPYPPLFGVTLGNFTESLAAYRTREGLRRRFPSSLVVPLDLPLNEVYPNGGDDVHAPRSTTPHRD